MRMPNVSPPTSAEGFNGTEFQLRHVWGIRSLETEGRTILLISDDAELHENLRRAANMVGQMVVRVATMAGVLPIAHAVKPAAVLLDLDFPSEAAWRVADSLLQEESCPPLLLLTAHPEQFDLRTAIRAGSVVDKSANPDQLLQLVKQTLAESYATRIERNALQRVMIQWLRPCRWSVPLTPENRFWGINE